MKKVLFKFLLVSMICVLALSLVACGGGNSGTSDSDSGLEAGEVEGGSEDGSDEAANGEDFVWFSAVPPAGFEIKSPGGTYTTIEFSQSIGGGNSAIIAPTFGAGNIASKLEDQLKSDTKTQGPDVKAGLFTWTTIDFTFNGHPSTIYMAQMTDDYVVYIHGWCIGPNDPTMLAFLERIKPSNDVEDMLGEAFNTSFPR